jgi:hypothetical protein
MQFKFYIFVGYSSPVKTLVAILSFLILLSFDCIAQDLEWVSIDAGVNTIFNKEIAIDYKDNVIAIGSFSGTVDFDDSQDSIIRNGRGEANAYVKKTNKSGKALWVLSFDKRVYRVYFNDPANPGTTIPYIPFKQPFFYQFIETEGIVPLGADKLGYMDFAATIKNLDKNRLRRFSFPAGSTFLWGDMTFELGILYDFDKSDYDATIESHRDKNIAIMDMPTPHLQKLLDGGCIGPGSRYENLLIAGHTDTAGDSMYNKNLSEARALDITDAIKLAVPGLVPSFLAPMGYGETRLKVPTADNKKESRNRRVEIQFIKL